MNIWKLVAIGLAAALVASVGAQTAMADRNPAPRPGLIGACFGQPNTERAMQSIEDTVTFLAKAETNKNGWRDRALAAANKAKDEITGGCSISYTK